MAQNAKRCLLWCETGAQRQTHGTVFRIPLVPAEKTHSWVITVKYSFKIQFILYRNFQLEFSVALIVNKKSLEIE